MQGDILVVIDMQNAYAENGPWACHNVGECADNIVKIIESGKSDVIMTEFLAASEPVGVWKEYNIVNAEINNTPFYNELMPCFENYRGKYPVISKSTYSCTSSDEFAKKALGAKRVVLTGVVAECCVLATAMALIDLGCYVVYISDGVAGISEETEKATELVLRGLDYLHCKVMTTEEYINE